jgi:uncharacterized membrane protein
LQILFTGLCAWPLFRLTQKMLGPTAGFWPVTIALAWLLNPLVHNIALYEFHALAFAAFALLWAAYFFQQKKFALFGLWAMLALLCREDIGLIITGFGIIASLEHRSWRWRLTPLIVGVLYVYGATQLTQLFGADSYKFSVYYSWLVDASSTLVHQPLRIIRHFLNIKTAEWALALLFPVAFIPLAGALARRWLWLLVGPCVQFALTNSGLSATLLQIHYAALFLPALFCATIAGIAAAQQKLNGALHAIGISKNIPLAAALLVTVVYTAITLGPLPQTVLAIGTSRLPSHNQTRQFLKTTISDSAAVASSYAPMSWLSSRENVYSFNYVFLGQQQFLTRPYFLPADTESLAIDYSDWLGYQAQYESQRLYHDTYTAAVNAWPQQLTDFMPIAAQGGVVVYGKNQNTRLSLVTVTSEHTAKTTQEPRKLSDGISLVDVQANDSDTQLTFLVSNVPFGWWRYYLRVTDAYNNTTNFPLGYGMLGHATTSTPYITMTLYPNKNASYITGQLVRIDAAGIELAPWRGTHVVIDREQLLGDPIKLE